MKEKPIFPDEGAGEKQLFPDEGADAWPRTLIRKIYLSFIRFLGQALRQAFLTHLPRQTCLANTYSSVKMSLTEPIPTCLSNTYSSVKRSLTEPIP